MTGVARRPGRSHPMLTVVPGDGSGHEGGEASLRALGEAGAPVSHRADFGDMLDRP